MTKRADPNQANPPTPSLLDTFAAAERSGIARQTLAKMRVEGGGPPFRKLGTKVVYPVIELDAWLAARPLRHSTAGTDSTNRSAQHGAGVGKLDG